MKYLLEIFSVFALTIGYIQSESAQIYSLDDANVDQLWSNFKSEHQKNFRTATSESPKRQVFFQNLQKINQHNQKFNKKQVTYSLGITRFADMTSSEFMEYVNQGKKQLVNRGGINIQTYKYPANQVLPNSVDWRTKGYVNPIQNQGSCGCCWTFSTVAAVEGQYFKKYKKLIKFSEQNLVDCVNLKYLNYSGDRADGCNGGDGNIAFRYINAFGLNTYSYYPFVSGDTGTWTGRCKYNGLKQKASVSGYVVIPANETVLKAALANVGPLKTAVYVSPNFQLYKSGVFVDSASCPKQASDANHEVNLVGYGTLNNTDYYLMRNQWGTTWGIDGYMLFARNNDNQCGIASDNSYPIIV